MKPKVIIYSDYICPFCYIGKDRVDKLQKEFDVDVEWRGFEIHPETPKEGATLEDLNMSPAYIEMIMANVNSLLDDAGLSVNSPTRISNSNLAMQMGEYARKENKFVEFNNGVFNAYWKEDIDIGSADSLFKIAKEAGLDEGKLRKFLEQTDVENEVKKYKQDAAKYHVTGVPTFIIGDQIVVGAQPYEVLQKAMKEELAK